MNQAMITYRIKSASQASIFAHLQACRDYFMPPLDQTVNIKEYAAKIFKKAVTFEAWSNGILVGLLAAYFNDQTNKIGFITNLSVIKEFFGQGVAKKLMAKCLSYAEKKGFNKITLTVNKNNLPAISLYQKFNFSQTGVSGDSVSLELKISKRK